MMLIEKYLEPSSPTSTEDSNLEAMMLLTVSWGRRPMSTILARSALICLSLMRQATTMPSVVRPRPAWHENTH